MKKLEEKYLPLGTVAKLKDYKKRVMIIGYCCTKPDNKEIYDYIGVNFPEGSLISGDTVFFNHQEIIDVSYYGLSDTESNEFQSQLKEISKIIKDEN